MACFHGDAIASHLERSPKAAANTKLRPSAQPPAFHELTVQLVGGQQLCSLLPPHPGVSPLPEEHLQQEVGRKGQEHPEL